MPFSEDLSSDIADLIVSNTQISAFAGSNRYVALHDDDPGSDCDSNELSGDGYARTQVSIEKISGALGVVIRNDDVVVFPVATGSKVPQVTYFSLWDNSTGGTPIGWGALSAPANWTSGSSLSLAVNAMVLTVIDDI